MRDLPILFSAPMVRAILDGSKTQTRRVAKEFGGLRDLDKILARFPNQNGCRYGQTGDRLWVRERIELVPDQEPDDGTGDVHSIYAADGSLTPADDWPWRRPYLASIHCPRGLSRITLEVTGVRVERLQDISEADAVAEGIERDRDHPELWQRGPLRNDVRPTPWTGFPKLAFQALWEGINGTESWDSNPWVWVIEFKRVKP